MMLLPYKSRMQECVNDGWDRDGCSHSPGGPCPGRRRPKQPGRRRYLVQEERRCPTQDEMRAPCLQNGERLTAVRNILESTEGYLGQNNGREQQTPDRERTPCRAQPTVLGSESSSYPAETDEERSNKGSRCENQDGRSEA